MKEFIESLPGRLGKAFILSASSKYHLMHIQYEQNYLLIQASNKCVCWRGWGLLGYCYAVYCRSNAVHFHELLALT